MRRNIADRGVLQQIKAPLIMGELEVAAEPVSEMLVKGIGVVSRRCILKDDHHIEIAIDL